MTTVFAKDGRPSILPPILDLAARVRDGEALHDIATQYGFAYQSLTSRFSQAGFASTGEKVQDARRRELRGDVAAPFSRPVWMLEGSCSRTDPEAWFPEVGSTPHRAKEICRGCDVVEECLQWALDTNEQYGVWGGKTRQERKRMKKATEQQEEDAA